MKGFWRHSLLLFCALRGSDLITLLGGLYFVPRYVSHEDLGAVLPAISFATFLALPLFAFAMTMMKEASVLAAEKRHGELKSLLRGAFAAGGLTMALALPAAAVIGPSFLKDLRVNDPLVGFLAVAAAFLGCLAPVYTDQLQSTRRFRELGVIEIAGAAARLAVMMSVMPFRALAGYFAGAATLPAVRMAGSLFCLQDELSERSEPFWNTRTIRRITLAFLAVLAYQAAPMGAGLMEQFVLRTALPVADSAGYYMATRLSDLLTYLTLPILIVLFPYTATAARRGESTAPFVRKCIFVTFLAAALWAVVLALFGGRLMSLLPHGGEYLGLTSLLPLLVLICALNAAQVFYTNTEVSAGRFGFLLWFAPLNLAYILALKFFAPYLASLDTLLLAFAGIAALRFGFSMGFLFRSRV